MPIHGFPSFEAYMLQGIRCAFADRHTTARGRANSAWFIYCSVALLRHARGQDVCGFRLTSAQTCFPALANLAGAALLPC